MIKRTLSLSVAVLALAAAALPSAAQQQRVGFVNSGRLLAEAPGLVSARQTLERELAPQRAAIDSLEQRLQAGQQQLQASTLSETARQQRQQELQTLFQQYQQRGQQAQQQAQQREAELMEPVMRQINAAIEAERSAGTYTYILDAGGNGILAVDPAVDITERVLARLRGGAAAPR